MKIIKRNGMEVDFDINKIIVAITKANNTVPSKFRLSEDTINSIAKNVENECIKRNHEMNVENIQDMVESELVHTGSYQIAKNYITYRYTHQVNREGSELDKKILSIVDLANEEVKQENSNKDPVINSTQRDYISGEVSRDLSMRLLVDPDIREAHDKGIIHFHDSDYFIQHMHNCFTGDTKFITDKGIRRFKDFKDGDKVFVKDKDGVLREATVHNYENQFMNRVVLTNGKSKHTVICTPDHRWFLNDGSITTNLRVGDRLLGVKDSTDFQISNKEDAYYFTLGFLIGDGTDLKNGSVRVRLCGNKNKWEYVFKQADWRISHPDKFDGDACCTTSRISKQDILNGALWKYLTPHQNRMMFLGYYSADGRDSNSKVAYTSDNRVASFIEYSSGIAGFYISSCREFFHDTPFKKNAYLIEYHFITRTPNNWLWRVESITPYGHGKVKTWCVEEPITHSFLLDKGIVTGNCDLVNLEDILQNGTVISDTLIEKPHSFSTACNISTQVIAQVASNQFGL